MRFEVEAIVRRPPEAVWSWWTDYGPVGHAETLWHGQGWSRRKVIAREGDRITMRESVLGVPIVTHTVELDAARRRFRERSKSFESFWAFEPHPDGTRVRRDFEMKSRPAPPEAIARALTQRDLDTHARQCERDLG